MPKVRCPACEAKIRIASRELPSAHCPKCKASLAGAETIPDDNPPAPRRGVKDIGGYHVDERLAEGGMATVYRAHDPGGQVYALKVLSREAAEEQELVERFKREADIGKRVRHEHLVCIHDSGKDHGRYFLVMDLVEGGDLDHILVDEEWIDWQRALDVLGQVCEGLAALEAAGIVHRDVKPENILIDDRGHARLADCGLAKLLDGGSADIAGAPAPALTVEGTQLGTPAFMPPEQIEDAMRATAAADVYGVAATLFLAVTGSLPFSGKSAIEVMNKVLNERAPRMSSFDAEVPPALDEVIDWCLEKDPKRRPADCRRLLELFEQVRKAPGDAASIRRKRRGWRRFLPWS